MSMFSFERHDPTKEEYVFARDEPNATGEASTKSKKQSRTTTVNTELKQ